MKTSDLPTAAAASNSPKSLIRLTKSATSQNEKPSTLIRLDPSRSPQTSPPLRGSSAPLQSRGKPQGRGKLAQRAMASILRVLKTDGIRKRPAAATFGSRLLQVYMFLSNDCLDIFFRPICHENFNES